MPRHQWPQSCHAGCPWWYAERRASVQELGAPAAALVEAGVAAARVSRLDANASAGAPHVVHGAEWAAGVAQPAPEDVGDDDSWPLGALISEHGARAAGGGAVSRGTRVEAMLERALAEARASTRAQPRGAGGDASSGGPIGARDDAEGRTAESCAPAEDASPEAEQASPVSRGRCERGALEVVVRCFSRSGFPPERVCWGRAATRGGAARARDRTSLPHDRADAGRGRRRRGARLLGGCSRCHIAWPKRSGGGAAATVARTCGGPPSATPRPWRRPGRHRWWSGRCCAERPRRCVQR